MTTDSCNKTNNSPTWRLIDLFQWKLIPERFGGGIPYIQKFKDAWVRHNKLLIGKLATRHMMPPELLAGVCWIEVAGDPDFIDRIAFKVRSFDWSGPKWIDENLTITKHPAKTSFGSVSIQLRTAAHTLGLDPADMSSTQVNNLAICLQKDVFNIEVVARHLRQLIDHDGLQKNPPFLTMDNVRIVGARYNRGIGLSLEKIKMNTSYGNFIVKFWERFSTLLRISIGEIMNTVTRVIAHLVAVCGLFFLLVLPVNKYSWMQEIDPSIVVDDPSGNSVIFSLLLLIIVCLIEIIVFNRAENIVDKAMSLTLVFIAMFIWLIRYFVT